MKPFTTTFTLLILLLFISGSTTSDKVPPGIDVANIMFKKTKEIKTMVFVMKKFERLNGELVEQRSSVKLSREPFKVYSKQLYPKEGIEVLYVEGERGNKALINPNGFPWINLKLDPYGSIMREDQHHTILDAGYDLVVSILEFLVNKYRSEIDSIVTNKGSDTYNGKDCWIVEMQNPYFKYIDYTIKEGENIIHIAERYMLSEHMIVEKNPEVDDFYDVVAGQVIQIPNDYSPKMTIYIEKDRMVPLMMKIYDEKGLYEQYEYVDLKVDPAISPEEFSSDYEDYDF